MDIRYQLGDRIWRAEIFDALPVGTKIQQHRGAGVIQKAENGWRTAGGVVYPPSNLLDNGYALAHVPPCDLVQPMSYLRYQWHWRQITRAAALVQGEGLADVDTAIRAYRLDNRDNRFPFGTGMRLHEDDTVNLLPEGSHVVVGDPIFGRYHGVFVRHGGTWDHLVGQRNSLNLAADHMYATVLTVGPTEVIQPWLTDNPAEGDALRIAKFKADVWRRAMQAKRDHEWCPTLERIMGFSWIDGTMDVAAAYGHDLGEVVTVDVARGLPDGTILTYADDRRTIYYMRSEQSSNPAGTVRLWSSDNRGSSTYASGGMTIARYPGLVNVVPRPEGWTFDQMYEAMPVGSVFQFSEQRIGRDMWVKAADGRCHYGRGLTAESLSAVIGAPPQTGQYTPGSPDFGVQWVEGQVVWMPGMPTEEVAVGLPATTDTEQPF